MQTPKKTIVLRWPRHAPQQSQLHFFAPQPQPQLPLAHGLAPHPDHQQRRQLQQWEFLQHQSRCCPVKTWIQVSETALTKTTSGHQHQHQHTHTVVPGHLSPGNLISVYIQHGWMASASTSAVSAAFFGSSASSAGAGAAGTSGASEPLLLTCQDLGSRL